MISDRENNVIIASRLLYLFLFMAMLQQLNQQLSCLAGVLTEYRDNMK